MSHSAVLAVLLSLLILVFSSGARLATRLALKRLRCPRSTCPTIGSSKAHEAFIAYLARLLAVAVVTFVTRGLASL